MIYASGPGWELHHGDAIAILPTLGPVDLVAADPPYSSGGAMRGDRMGSTSSKYLRSDSKQAAYLPQFAGDNRDQRGYLAWSALWMGMALDLANPGGVIVCFADWRQTPITSDALQAGGWIWRGMMPWTKPDPRPSRGRFSQSSEFMLWGSAGPMADEGQCHPGNFDGRSPRDREHITQKPLELMKMLIAICPPGGVVLDPFNGSGTTGVAAILSGRRYIGVERTEEYCAISARRLSEACGRTPEHNGQIGLLGNEAAI